MRSCIYNYTGRIFNINVNHMKERTVTILKDGAIVRLHNRRINIIVEDNKVIIQFDKPKEKQRGIERVTISLSTEVMDGIMQAIDLLKEEDIL